MREVRVHCLPREIERESLRGSAVVVIDLLRATSTICQALAAGAVEVVPFLEVDEARAASEKDRAQVVLGGERHGKRIAGFDLGNSPSEYTPVTIGGKRLFLSTTNGTRALEHAREAKRVLCGSFLNLSAVAASVEEEPRVEILCAGTNGVESREDILVAGAIIEKLLQGRHHDWKRDAKAQAALEEWRSRGDDLAAELRETPGGRNLVDIGMDHDLVDCARIDALDVVAELDTTAWRITAR